MQLAFLTIQIVISILLISIILLQKTSSDSIGGLGANNQMMSNRTTNNFLTKTTAIFALAFMINSIILANIANKTNKSIIEYELNSSHSKNKHLHAPLAK